MGIETAVGPSRTDEEPYPSRPIYLVAGLFYPAWYVFTPTGVHDPWRVWWIVAGLWTAVVLVSYLNRGLERHLPVLLAFCSWLVTAHQFGLAARNGMHSFYAVASAIAVLAAIAAIRNRRALFVYAALTTLVGAALPFAYPHPLTAAYWGGLLPLLVLGYFRLAAQETAGRMAAEYRDRLEFQVAARTGELRETNQCLRREIEERERLESELRLAHQLEVVGRLAAAVSHEFNNLLCTIGVYSELLLDRIPAESDLRREIEQIQNAHRQATAISRQLLALSRPSQTRFESTDLNAAIERVLPALQGMLGPAVDLEIHRARGLCLIWANPDAIEQILVNLVLNARDAMPSGGTLAIATSSDDSTIGLCVSDTGIGMDAATRERAFEPFYTTKASGTGLGLSIVHTLVSQARGHVRIESEPGRGTRFEFSWPRTLGEAREVRTREEPQRPEAGSETILLVEDQDDLRAGLGRILTGAGYRVLEASDGQQALKVVTTGGEDVQLVVTDVVMPRMGGLEIAEALSAVNPGLPILFVSGQLHHASLRSRVLPLGAPLLEKPFTAADLCRQVRQLLDARLNSLADVSTTGIGRGPAQFGRVSPLRP